eukprot:TRINITY_DN4892_c0_g1_i1.p1 TRINITY_DN4892_c0_g1~~TRINITY_DN4892_c0_g1_i1.p1  ORF type:complete len:405 (+),score=75.09 TRINITY_DN4892_c0_g1_i1:29-1216(+)
MNTLTLLSRVVSKGKTVLRAARGSQKARSQVAQQLIRAYSTKAQKAASLKDVHKDHIWTLSANYYTDPKVFEAEKKNIFGKTWQCVGRLDQLQGPGDYFTATVGSLPIVVMKNDEGKIHAFHNVCRHRAHPVLPFGSSGKCESLRCGYHGWLYDKSGKLKKAASLDLSEDLKEGLSLFPIKVEHWNNWVFINMDTSTSVSLREYLGPIVKLTEKYNLDTYKYFREATHEVDINWKTYVDNYQEGYHVPVAHPALDKVVDCRYYKVDIWNHPMGGGHAIHSVPPRKGKEDNSGLWVYLYPNLGLNIYSYGTSIERWEPVSHNKMKLIYTFFENPADPLNSHEKLADTNTTLTKEDLDLCLNVQKNLENGIYSVGLLHPEKENGVSFFQKEYSKMMK